MERGWREWCAGVSWIMLSTIFKEADRNSTTKGDKRHIPETGCCIRNDVQKTAKKNWVLVKKGAGSKRVGRKKRPARIVRNLFEQVGKTRERSVFWGELGGSMTG